MIFFFKKWYYKMEHSVEEKSKNADVFVFHWTVEKIKNTFRIQGIIGPT